MSKSEPSIAVLVDASNPGQFFACCGLLELAERLWGRAEGWFADGRFCIDTKGGIEKLVQAIGRAEVSQVDPEDDTSSPVSIGEPFRGLLLDWWHDKWSGGRELKVWAGTMESARIAKAMQFAIRSEERFQSAELLNIGTVAFDPENPDKKVEPYYFDARRGPNAHSRDVGFSPNDLRMTTTAFPAVELLCLVGLQRCLPAKKKDRIFDYYTWAQPLPPCLISGVVPGLLELPGQVGYRFENWYRTGQKKHKAFRSAILINNRG